MRALTDAPSASGPPAMPSLIWPSITDALGVCFCLWFAPHWAPRARVFPLPS